MVKKGIRKKALQKRSPAKQSRLERAMRGKDGVGKAVKKAVKKKSKPKE